MYVNDSPRLYYVHVCLQLSDEEFRQGDRYSPFLHDALILYALALNETLRDGKDPHDGEEVSMAMRNKFFSGEYVTEKFKPHQTRI